jgi:hypothetical protein
MWQHRLPRTAFSSNSRDLGPDQQQGYYLLSASTAEKLALYAGSSHELHKRCEAHTSGALSMIAGTAKDLNVRNKKFYQDCRDFRTVPRFVHIAEALPSTNSTLVFCLEACVIASMDLLSD